MNRSPHNREALNCLQTETALLSQSLQRPLLLVGAVVVVLTVAGPVLINGDNTTAGPWSGLAAFEHAWQLGALAVPTLVVMSVGRDFDLGTRRSRFLGGADLAVVSVAQGVAAFTTWLRTTLWIAAAALAAGTIDWLLRLATGQPATMTVDEGALGQGVLRWTITAVLAGWVSWLVVLACRSARLGVSVTVIAIATLLVPLLRLNADAHTLLGLHPVALAWSLVDPFPAEALQIDRQPLTFASAALATAILVALASRSLRSPE